MCASLTRRVPAERCGPIWSHRAALPDTSSGNQLGVSKRFLGDLQILPCIRHLPISRALEDVNGPQAWSFRPKFLGSNTGT